MNMGNNELKSVLMQMMGHTPTHIPSKMMGFVNDIITQNSEDMARFIKRGKRGNNGKDGMPGMNGMDGKMGLPPKHEWMGTKIRFENQDGTWGDWTELRGKDGTSSMIHGGGLSKISHDTTLTGDGTPKNPLKVANSGSGTVTSVSIVTANGISGSVATATTTPAITLTLGVITPTSVNGLTLTSQAIGFTIAGGTTSKTLTVPLDATVSGINTGDQTSVSGNAGTATALQTARAIYGNNFDGTAALTQIITSTYGGTGNGFTKFSGATTSEKTYTLPDANATIARTDAAQSFIGTQTFTQVLTTNNAITASGNAATIPITSKINTVTNNSAATLTITLTTTSAIDGQQVIVRILDFSAVAQTITWVNTENSTISVPTTSNGSTTLPLTVGFMYNSNTSKWKCLASA